MSRIDYITIGLVAVGLLVLVYLFFKISQLNDPEKPRDIPTQEELIDTSKVHTPTAVLDTTPIQNEGPKLDSLEPNNQKITPTKEEKKADKTDYPYLVVAASFNTTELANQELDRLKKLGYTQSEVGYFNRGSYASVIVERFNNYDAAKKIADELKKKHKINAYVHRKRATQ